MCISSTLPPADLESLLAMVLVPGVGPAAIHNLLARMPPAELFERRHTLNAKDAPDRLTDTLVRWIRDGDCKKFLALARRQVEWAKELGVDIVTCFDPGYPENLRAAAAAPPLLFVKGNLHQNDWRSVAVVGSRDATRSGCERARHLAHLLVDAGVVVVSGLARGIDAAAHRGAVEAGGRTIAVVGTGLDRIYPAENGQLAESIACNGALLSQFPLGTPPKAANFPQRNKTMALLSLATVVVEAGPQSGAKMQADFALRSEFPRRHVFLLQSLIDSQTDTGWPTQFLRRGAERVTQFEDVIRALDQETQPGRPVQQRLPV